MLKPNIKSNGGFSFIEVLIVVTISAVALALSAPNLTTFFFRQRLNTANREIYQALRLTQSEASRRKEIWQLSLRKQNGVVQWAKHHDSVSLPEIAWHDLDETIDFDLGNTHTVEGGNDGIMKIRFDHNGHLVDPNNQISNQTPQITLRLSKGDPSGFARRCVFIETIIGAMRVEKDQECK